MRRLGLTALLATLVLLVLTAPAGATYGWCRTDPIVRIGGKEANIFVSSTTPILDQAVGATIVVVTVPAGVGTELVATDAGFGFGERVYFAQSLDLKVSEGNGRIEVLVSVFVPARGEPLPVLVEFVPSAGDSADSAQGTTNQWVTFRSKL